MIIKSYNKQIPSDKPMIIEEFFGMFAKLMNSIFNNFKELIISAMRNNSYNKSNYSRICITVEAPDSLTSRKQNASCLHFANKKCDAISMYINKFVNWE